MLTSIGVGFNRISGWKCSYPLNILAPFNISVGCLKHWFISHSAAVKILYLPEPTLGHYQLSQWSLWQQILQQIHHKLGAANCQHLSSHITGTLLSCHCCPCTAHAVRGSWLWLVLSSFYFLCCQSQKTTVDQSRMHSYLIRWFEEQKLKALPFSSWLDQLNRAKLAHHVIHVVCTYRMPETFYTKIVAC